MFTQLEATAQLMSTVPAGAFRPVPQVDGGVVRLDFLRLPEAYPRDFQIFERIVRYTFHQRRKMLKSSLSGLAGNSSLLAGSGPRFHPAAGDAFARRMGAARGCDCRGTGRGANRRATSSPTVFE